MDGCSQKPFVQKFIFSQTTTETESGATSTEKTYLLNSTTPYLLISKSSGTKLQASVNDSDNWDLLLIHDSVSPNAYPKKAKENSTYFMYHSRLEEKNYLSGRGLPEIFDNANITPKRKLGMHWSSGYPLLNEIFDAWQDNGNGGTFDLKIFDTAFKKIADWIYPDMREIAFKFLHGEIDIEELNILPNFLEIKQIHPKDKQTICPITASEKDKKILDTLRDVVLTEVVVEG